MKLLAKQTSIETICQIKSEFAVNWIPVLSWLIMAPNSAVRHGQDFADFSSSHGFTHVTCSSKPMVKQTIKQLLKKSKDLYLALLMYRAAPLQNGLFPSNFSWEGSSKPKFPFFPKSLKPATANHGSQQRKTGSQLQPLAHCNRAPSAPARWSSLDQGPEMIRQGCCSIHSPISTSSKHREGLSDTTEQPLSPLQLQHLANDSSVTRTAHTTHTYAATCSLPLPVTNSCCCFTTAPSNQQITVHMRSGVCVNKPNRLDL